ncbi:MAG: heme-binding domain-containing protein [Chitinophagaceae bacterium]|nr:heme-binding domain-containing protein [Chitinophagaceae bacterium]
MKKFFKRLFVLLLAAFVVIQLFRPAKNKAEGMSKNDISTLYPVPEDVQNILKTSCYDCHSNNTVYPWYAEVQPVAWWLDSHIQDGKKDLNFSEFASYRIRRQYKKLEEVNELVKKDEMPLDSYLWIHKDAKLSEPQKLTLATWVNAVRDTMEAHYPIDSLVRKK